MSQTLYRLFDAQQQLLYVGISMRAWARLHEHADSKHWWPDVKSITTEHFSTRRDVSEAERAAIAIENPRYNVAHSKQTYKQPGKKDVLETFDFEQKVSFIFGRSDALAHINKELEYMKEFLKKPQIDDPSVPNLVADNLSRTWWAYQDVWNWFRDGLQEVVLEDLAPFKESRKNSSAYKFGVQWVVDDLREDAIGWCQGWEQHYIPHSDRCLGLLEMANILTDRFDLEELA